jgi:anti-anti-sigma factor
VTAPRFERRVAAGGVRARAASPGIAVRVSGELDLALAPHVEAVCGWAAAAGLAGPAEVDLHGLELIDSTGLRALLALHERLGPVTLRGARGSVARVLRLTRFAERLRIVWDE